MEFFPNSLRLSFHPAQKEVSVVIAGLEKKKVQLLPKQDKNRLTNENNLILLRSPENSEWPCWRSQGEKPGLLTSRIIFFSDIFAYFSFESRVVAAKTFQLP